MKPLKLPANAWKDHKKLTRYLADVEDYVNKILRACQIQSRLIATELVARPTYAEEFQNIRNNVTDTIRQGDDGGYAEVASQHSQQQHGN